MGKLQRVKGKVFERKIARRLREEFPEYAETIRRSIQSRAAEESDVCGFDGFWLECQDAIKPTPLKKLEQAEHDLGLSRETAPNTIPVAITHRRGTRSIDVTLRIDQLVKMVLKNNLATASYTSELCGSVAPVTLDLDDWIALVRWYLSNPRKKQRR